MGLVRALVIVCMLLMLFSGLAVLALGIWMAADSDEASKYTHAERAFNIIAGGLLIITALVGLLPAVFKFMRQRWYGLMWVALLLLTIIFLAFSSGVWAVRADSSISQTDHAPAHGLFAVELWSLALSILTSLFFLHKTHKEFARHYSHHHGAQHSKNGT